MTFRTRSFITALVTAAVTLAVALMMVSWSVRRTTVARLERALVDKARIAAHTLSIRPADSGADADAEADALATLLSARVTIVAADGRVIGDSDVAAKDLPSLDNHALRPELAQARQQGVGIAQRHSATVNSDMLYVALPLQAGVLPEAAQLRLAVPLTEVREQLAAVWRSAFVAAGAALLTALALAWAASAFLAQRIAAIAAVARRYAAGDFSRPARDYGTDEIGTVARVLDASIRDIERRARELAADRARMEAILGGMAEGVLVVNHHGVLQSVNPAARRMLRLRETIEGRHYVEILRHPDIASQVGTALRGEQQPESLELPLQQELTVVVRSAPVVAADARGAVVVLHDISDLRRADRVRRDFVANVSHELRTPLTAVRGYVEALLDGADDPAETRRFLEIISRHTLRMERLVRDLLRLARLDAGQDQRDHVACSVDALFAGVEAELVPSLEARHQRVERTIDEAAEIVHGDPAKLHDVFRNLLENAIKYSPEHSTIRMGARRIGGQVLLTVADQGPGVPEADLPRVFERFYRVDKARSRGERDPGGTGLGLAIAKHLIELHGGSVTAANHPGGGAIFTVALPAS
jgi:two-component system, OmpR family, phosphate regulon sensor histidine kinase PhoR